jgi:tRNA threonylcarbamoyl adenosine modification protein YeaZ
VILALDSSASIASVALVDAGRVIREIAVEAPRGRGGMLFAALEDLLGDGTGLTRVVVGTGPGSYNGIRSAIAAGWGIAFARDVPLVGLCSLNGLEDGTFCAVGDARRGQFYFAEIVGGRVSGEPELLEDSEVAARVGARPVVAPASLAAFPAARIVLPRAGRLGLAGAELPARDIPPEPIYLKAPFITAPKSGL